METQLFTAVIQCGSLGILAYLIIFGLPALFRDIRSERKEDRASHEKQVETISSTFVADKNSERETCERRHAEIIAHQNGIKELVRELRHAVLGVSQAVTMHNTLVDMVLKIRSSATETPAPPGAGEKATVCT